jgi:DNA end-binding protein Ku
MPARAAWRGFLRIRQLAVPVRAFTACRSTPDIALHQLHVGCGERVRQQRFCPVHGPVTSEEIGSGFEHEPGRCLPLDANDLVELQPPDEKGIDVDCFVPSSRIDPVHHSGRTYYLVPDGPMGQRPFGVLRDGLADCDRHGVARVVLSRREQLVIVRPLSRVLAMTVLEYAERVREVADYESDVGLHETGSAERELISNLIATMTDSELDLAAYRDPNVAGLVDLVERRLAQLGFERTGDDTEGDEARLIAALRASLAETGRSASANGGPLPARTGGVAS